MKKIYSISLALLFTLSLFAGTPVIDGTFDGEAVWGAPKGTGNGTAGWGNANSKKVYVTFDNNYVYFCAEITTSDWMQWSFVVNTKTGGASADSWSRQVFYQHANKPDYTFRGTFGGYSEYHSWNGTSWDGVGTSIPATEFAESITGTDASGFVELRVPKATFGTASICDLQFYVTGDNNDHGCFDAVPDDNNSAGWNPPSSTTNISNYITGAALPVELVSFTASFNNNDVTLNWSTVSEINNKGFEVESSSGSGWKIIAFVNGKGTTSEKQNYSYTDQNVTPGVHSYRLKQIDFDGTFEYSNIIETDASAPVEFSLNQNYPNPFNPSTRISYRLPVKDYVVLKIYDALGKEASVLVNEEKEAGSYEIEFNASGLPSGTYFYKLMAGSFSEVKKMMLIK